MFEKLLDGLAWCLPWGLKQVCQGCAFVVGVLEQCGFLFGAAGLTLSLVLFALVKGIVALGGGPIPLTPGVVFGLKLWVIFLTIVLVHSCVDGILVLCGEQPLCKKS